VEPRSAPPIMGGAAQGSGDPQDRWKGCIVRETEQTNENAPNHRVFVGHAEIGAGWSKQSRHGRDYLSVKLDDPRFTALIYANLFNNEDCKTFNLVRTRSNALT
jgi:uncharacterized protein (DUF736 family)